MIRNFCCLVLLVNFQSCQLIGTKCYGELGCLELNPDWYDPMIRPINLYPLPREVIDTKFVLYTRNNTLEGQKLRAAQDDDILRSNFHSQRETKIIIHGYIENTVSSKWIKEMRLELLKHGDVNVFEVDWDKGALRPYNQATANTRLVGLEIAFFVNHLKENYGLNPAHVHIIGHSLGSHTAGYAGEKIPGLGRITGLDPAGPSFLGMGTHVRLDPSDAAFVDVIHTDGTIPGFGMSDPCGHLDFYPNDGKQQPGCEVFKTLSPLTLLNQDTVKDAFRGVVFCNHARSVSLFIESINSQCSFIGHRCSGYQKFLKGECFTASDKTSDSAVMGLRARKVDSPPLTKYYFLTSAEAPYCRYHYRVTLDLAKPSEAEHTVQGQIKITLYGAKTTREMDLTPSGPEHFEHGKTRVFLNTDSVDIGPVHKADIRWRRNINILSPKDLLSSAFGCNDHLYIRSLEVDDAVEDPARGRQSSRTLYPVSGDYADLTSVGSVTLYDQSPR